MKRHLPFAALALLVSAAAYAQSCSVAVTPVNFGNYSPFSASALDSTGKVTVSCSGNAGFSVSLNAGLHGEGVFGERGLSDGHNILSYQLFTNASHSVAWGDGTGGTSVVRMSQSGSLTIYGRITARQVVGAGTYTDTALVTVTF